MCHTAREDANLHSENKYKELRKLGTAKWDTEQRITNRRETLLRDVRDNVTDVEMPNQMVVPCCESLPKSSYRRANQTC